LGDGSTGELATDDVHTTSLVLAKQVEAER
jgi:hypothetical protein